MKLKIAILAFLPLIVSCYKTPTYPDVPAIEFDSYQTSSDPYAVGTDGNLRIKFTDGDGDLGKTSNSDLTQNCFIKNLKYNYIDSLVLPIIPQKGTSKAISGTIDFKLISIISVDFCTLGVFKKPTDTLSFQIEIVDRAGHKSNTLVTPDIVIACP
jgi:hypothetical protein